MEWARLLLHIRAEFLQRDGSAPTWLLEDARHLMAAAIRDAWSTDGDEGFVYSVDWEGNPVVHDRIRWVVVEALGAVAALFKATGDREYEDWYRRFWSYCDRYLIDFARGSWWQELDRHNAATSDVWDGKPDIYHLFHCLLVPRLPLSPALAPALAGGLLDRTD
jgi:sulfoquinovose isomerase